MYIDVKPYGKQPQIQCNNVKNLKASYFSTDIFTDEASNPDINFYNKKLQKLSKF